MSLGQEIKKIRKKALLTQTQFAEKLEVSFTSVNRWETGKARPNVTAMKNIKEFCFQNNIEYSDIEKVWLDYTLEE